MPNVLEIKKLQNPDSEATEIANKFITWEAARVKWYENAKETLENLYATSSRDIYNQTKETDNTTHIPKITQIRDMLVTYYLDALFSLPDYIDWEPFDDSATSKEARNSMKSMMRQLLVDSDFNKTAEQLVEDYVDYGNAFASVINVKEFLKNDVGQNMIYEGPKAVRIDPQNIFFDPLAVSFEKSPKIIRTIKTLGELLAESEENVNCSEEYKKALDIAINDRRTLRETVGITNPDLIKDDMCKIAGFSTWSAYYASDIVELLTFYGDLYDISTNKLQRNRKIVIMDRSKILLNEPIDDYGYRCNILKAGWRDRKDNLWSMSPLDNIKGMQFMIDFLENKRADIFNYLSNPMYVTKGDVEMPEFLYPGVQIGLDTDSDFRSITPDATALQADLYIDRYLMQMEEMAGTPREAMGFRTPGEKTAFEVSQLNTAASRLFNKKVHKFEEEMLEPLLTLMFRMFLAQSGKIVKVKMVDNDGVVTFQDIPVDEIMTHGRFVATGSRTYTEKAKIAQTILQIYNSGIVSDQLVFDWFSPRVIAEAIAYSTGLDKLDGLLKENARIGAETSLAKQQEFARQQVEETQVRGIQNAQQGIM